MGRDEKLNQRQRNALYRQSKELKREIRDTICTQKETRIPSRENVKKFLGTDIQMKNKIKYYKDCLRAQGASPRELNVEKLRRQ